MYTADKMRARPPKLPKVGAQGTTPPAAGEDPSTHSLSFEQSDPSTRPPNIDDYTAGLFMPPPPPLRRRGLDPGQLGSPLSDPSSPNPNGNNSETKGGHEKRWLFAILGVLLLAFFRFTYKSEPDPAVERQAAEVSLTPKEEIRVVGQEIEDAEEEAPANSETVAGPSGVVVLESAGSAPVIAAGEGLLMIDGDLADQIFVDGLPRGTLPIQLGLEPGQFLIKAEKAGFQTVWKWAGLTLGEKTEIQIQFD